GVHGPPADAEIRRLGALTQQLRVRFSGARSRLRPDDLARGETAKGLVDRGDRFIRADGTCERDDRARRRVAALHELPEAFGRHTQHDLLASGYFPTERVTRVEELVDQGVHAILRVVGGQAELLDDAVAFRFCV